MVNFLERLSINCSADDPASWITAQKICTLLQEGTPAYTFSFSENDVSSSLVVPELIKEFNLELILSSKEFFSDEEGYKTCDLYRSEDVLCSVDYTSKRYYDAEDFKGAFEVKAITHDKSVHTKIDKLFEKIQASVDNEDLTQCWALVQERYGLNLSPLDLRNTKFIPENYVEKVVAQREKILTALSSPKPSGRVTIISGPPGTGKTHFIQALLPEKGNLKTKFVYLPAHLAGNLDTPDLLKFLLDQRNTKLIFIIEDCDSLVAPRAMDNVNTLSTFLNLTDGILGSTLDLHFIVSTNEKKAKFDPAITRPGRLLEIVEVEMLPAEQANSVVKRIQTEQKISTESGNVVFNKPVSLAEVYARTLGATVFESKERPIGLR